MINIQNTRTFYYDNDRYSVTVYGDSDDPNKWFIVPTATFARRMVKGFELPEFAFLEFDTNQGVRGTCSFTTELIVSPAALQAVYANLGTGITIGQFDWVQAQAFFVYQVGGKEYTMNAVPSRYANNRAAFVVDLPNQEWVNTFKTAFGPGQGSESPFRIEYNVLALSKLPAVNVTVKYDSAIAFDYQKQIDIDRNVWGKETSRRETIKEQLRNSDSGSTDINWNIPNPSPELQQRVLDWAWITLEGLVQKAVDDAIRFVGEKNADKINMSATSSFERKYAENQVIEWSITPFALLPSFDQLTWNQVYSKGDTRKLSVSFTIRDSLTEAKIKSVQVNVKYPTKVTGNSHLFLPAGPTSWTYEADGTDPYSAAYEYQYQVEFEDPATAYTSPWIPTAISMVVLPLTALGIQTAVFVGGNVQFDKVDFVLIDFFFNMPDGVNKHEQVKLVANGVPLPIPSRSHLPSTNEYSYQLTFVMKDTSQIVVTSQKVFPPQNANLVNILWPLQEQWWTVGVINPPEGSSAARINRVQLNARYEDPLNKVLKTYRWSFAVAADSEYSEGEPWVFDAPVNPTGSFVDYSGSVIMSSGPVRTLKDIRNQTGFINLSYAEMPFTVEVDPFQVDWVGGVTMVQVNLFCLENSPTSDAAILAALDTRTYIEAQSFMQSPSGATTPKQYYTFLSPVGEAVVYYYKATYFHATGPDTYVDETTSQAKKITLPKDGTAAAPRYIRIQAEAESYEATAGR